jgi:hypothetical protein
MVLWWNDGDDVFFAFAQKAAVLYGRVAGGKEEERTGAQAQQDPHRVNTHVYTGEAPVFPVE